MLGERGDLVEDGPAGAGPARRRDLDPFHDRHAQAADQALEHGLVHPDRRGGHARSGIREVVGLEQRLDGAVLAERAVERGKDDRGDGARGDAIESLAGLPRTARADDGGVVEGAGMGAAR